MQRFYLFIWVFVFVHSYMYLFICSTQEKTVKDMNKNMSTVYINMFSFFTLQ